MFLSYEIYKSKTKRKLNFNEEIPSVNITVQTDVIIGEVEREADFTKPEDVEKVRRLIEKNMDEDLTQLINTAQSKLNCDILGIGAQMQREDPKMWEKYKDNWDEIFKKLEITVDNKIEVTGSGIDSGTVKKELLK